MRKTITALLVVYHGSQRLEKWSPNLEVYLLLSHRWCNEAVGYCSKYPPHQGNPSVSVGLWSSVPSLGTQVAIGCGGAAAVGVVRARACGWSRECAAQIAFRRPPLGPPAGRCGPGLGWLRLRGGGGSPYTFAFRQPVANLSA